MIVYVCDDCSKAEFIPRSCSLCGGRAGEMVFVDALSPRPANGRSDGVPELEKSEG